MLKLSFAGSIKNLMDYLAFAEWAITDAENRGAKVEKIFSDLSGYTAK